jgi:hypothetical protein
MFAESVDLIGGEIIQTNTDGLLYRIHESKIDDLNKVRTW